MFVRLWLVMITEEVIKHVAKLARLALKDEDVAKFAKQISSVFDYMKILDEVDTDGVKETSQVTGLLNVMQKDKINKDKPSGEELLACSELPVDSNQIRVKNAIN